MGAKMEKFIGYGWRSMSWERVSINLGIFSFYLNWSFLALILAKGKRKQIIKEINHKINKYMNKTYLTYIRGC